MNYEMDNHLKIDSIHAFKLYVKYTITNYVELKNGKELISFFD